MVFVYSDVGKTLFREMGDIFIKFSLFFLIAISIILLLVYIQSDHPIA